MRILILASSNKNMAIGAIMNAGKRRGHKMLVADPMNMNLLISNIPSGYDRIYLNEGGRLLRLNIKDVNCIVPRIGQNINYSSLILDHLSYNLGIYSPQSAEGILNAANKLKTLQLCSDAGLPTPRTVGINLSSPLPALIEKLGGFPVVIKLLHGSHGEGVALLNDKKSAISTIQSLMKARTSILMQQYIESQGKDYRVIVMGGKVVASYQRSATRGEFRANLSRGGQGVPAKISEEDKRICIQAAQAVGLSIAGVDILKDKSGRTFIIEVNANFGFQVERITGVDVADQIIQFVEKNVKGKIQNHTNIRQLQNENQILRHNLSVLQNNTYLASAYKRARGKQVSYQDRNEKKRTIRVNNPEDILKIMVDTFQLK